MPVVWLSRVAAFARRAVERRGWLLLPVVVLAAGCSTERPWINEPAVGATSTQIFGPDRSFGFFGGVDAVEPDDAAQLRGRLPQAGPGAIVGPASRSRLYRTRLYWTGQCSYLDGKRRPYVHLVDGGLSDNLGIRRLLHRALAEGGLRKSLRDSGIPDGSVHKMVLIVVNSERDPQNDIDQDGEVPNTAQVADALLFGAGARQTTETQEFLSDVVREWRDELRRRSASGVANVFASDAEFHMVQVNLRDAPENASGPRLLQVPTALSILDTEVTGLIEAARTVLQRSQAFQALQRSLGVVPAAGAAP